MSQDATEAGLKENAGHKAYRRHLPLHVSFKPISRSNLVDMNPTAIPVSENHRPNLARRGHRRPFEPTTSRPAMDIDRKAAAENMKRCVEELEDNASMRRVRRRSERTERRSESLVDESLDIKTDSPIRRSEPLPRSNLPVEDAASEEPDEDLVTEPPEPVAAVTTRRRPLKLKPSKPVRPPTLTDALNLALFTLPPSTLLNEDRAVAVSDAARALADVATRYFRKVSDPSTPSENNKRVPCCRRPTNSHDHYLKCYRKQIGIALARFSRDIHRTCPYAGCEGRPWDKDHRDNWAARYVGLTCQVVVDGTPCGVHFTQLGRRHLETEHGIVSSDTGAYVEWCEGCRSWIVGEALRREHEEECKER